MYCGFSKACITSPKVIFFFKILDHFYHAENFSTPKMVWPPSENVIQLLKNTSSVTPNFDYRPPQMEDERFLCHITNFPFLKKNK